MGKCWVPFPLLCSMPGTQSDRHRGIVLPVVLIMLMVVSWFTIQLLRNAIESNKEMISYLFYLEQMKQAEESIIKQATKLQNKVQDVLEEISKQNSLNNLSLINEMNKILPETMQIVGFVPYHLEFGCQEGVYIVKIESGLLETHWMLRLN